MKVEIKTYRKQARLKQTELAEKIGVTLRTIQKYESGEISPPLEKLEKIAKVLDVPMQRLIVEDDADIGADTESIGEAIRRYRRNRNITQEQLAQSIGVKRSVISKYENGSIEPSLTQIKAIAAVLKVSIVSLIDGGNESETRGQIDLDLLIEQEQAEYLRVQGEENLWIRLLNEAVHQRILSIFKQIEERSKNG